MSACTYGLTASDLKGSAVEGVFNLAYRQCGINMSIIFPKDDGWGHLEVVEAGPDTDFCRMIRSTKEGAKHCRMCHVLMAVTACSQGVTEQKCHAGATIFVNPIEEDGTGGMAILTSCAFRHEEKDSTWKFVEHRGKQLGLDEEKLRGVFEQLPDLDSNTSHCLREIMPLAITAIKELGRRLLLEKEVTALKNSRVQVSAGELLKQEFADASEERSNTKSGVDTDGFNGKDMPAMIKVVCSLVTRRPQTPYTVEELASAARMTPNYFSSLFHKHTGQCFMDYLTDRRMALAKQLLMDPSMNIGEVAALSGYDDPGYFTRRFRKKTGVTPKAWREKGAAG